MTMTALQIILDRQSESLAAGRTPKRPLSPRERQILDLVTGGKTQKEVAFELGLSAATVRVLYARAMAKLGRVKRGTSIRSV